MAVFIVALFTVVKRGKQPVYQWKGVCMCVCVCTRAKSLQSCPTLCDPWTVACQAPLSMGWGSLVGCRLWGSTELDMTEET